MFQFIGFGEILNIFVLPFIGLLLSVLWVIHHRNEDKEDDKNSSTSSFKSLNRERKGQ
ncbi:hypothetical protein ACVS9P_02385 [Caproicibacterium sp. NSD3]